jgi:hypothetical protein
METRMSKAKRTLVEAFLERVSRGAVPMGGFYWVDPKDLRGHGENVTVASTPKPTPLDVAPKATGGWFAKWWPQRRSGELS